MLLRITNMRPVDLDVFDFDFDLTWMAFFLDGHERVLGRFGGRTPGSANSYHSLDGLRFALEAAMKKHKEMPPAPPAAKPAQRTVEQYPAINKLAPKACIHCHQTYEFRRDWLQANQRWSPDEVWVYPLPENIGLTLALEQQNRVTRVEPQSPAAIVGLKAGDVLHKVNGLSVYSFGDLQYALHKAPAKGSLPIEWLRGSKALDARLTLTQGWKKTDLSWRPSLRTLEPASGLHGQDLTAAEKKTLGLKAEQLAFRQGNFLTKQAQLAGIEINDIVLGIDGKHLEMTARQFDIYVRLNCSKDETITVNVIRKGQRLDVKMKLTGT